MPSNRHLEFADVADFTPGYFSVGDWLMPGNGSQEMLDCRPDPGGGLRASVKPTSFPTTGIPGTARVIGMYTALRQGESGSTADNDYYLAVIDGSAVKIYRWNNALSSNPTSWTLIKSHAAGSSAPNPVQFDSFMDSAGKIHVVWTLADLSTDDGLWSLQFSYQAGQGSSATDEVGATLTASVTKRLAGFASAVAVQDGIVIVAIGARQSTLRWCASQDITTWPAPNNLPLQVSRAGQPVSSITTFAPSDLLIGMAFAPWVLIQGDITDPVVRTMSDEKVLGYIQRGHQTPAGLSFLDNTVGVAATQGGSSFTDLSTQIDPATWLSVSENGSTGSGEVIFGGNLLFAPKGLIYDFRTQGWHRSSVLVTSKSAYHGWWDGFGQQFFIATGDTGFSLYTFDGAERTRNSSFRWKSAPLHRPDGRQVELREVQVYARSYADNAAIAVTVNGTQRTITMPDAGEQQLTFLFSERAEVLDVQVDSQAAASEEAPSIEVVRIGTHSRHTLL